MELGGLKQPKLHTIVRVCMLLGSKVGCDGALKLTAFPPTEKEEVSNQRFLSPAATLTI